MAEIYPSFSPNHGQKQSNEACHAALCAACFLNNLEQGNGLELLRQQAILVQFGELALESDSLDVILTEACRLVGKALGTDLAKVMELQQDGRSLLVRAGVGWKPGVVGFATVDATDMTSAGHALNMGGAMISHDIAVETRFIYPPFLTDNGVRAMANVAINGGEGRPPFGILEIDSRTPRWFTDETVAFLCSFANLLAAAVDRLRVVGEVRSLQTVVQVSTVAETALRQSNEMLEAEVAERTRELVEANAKLRTEIEERQRVEEALSQSRIEAIGQLTGGIAHDFNNLLGIISGNLELLRIRAAQGRAAEFEGYIEAALSSTDRASAMTHRLLAFSRRQTLDPKPTDVNRLVGSMQDLFSRTVGPGIQIETRLADELWPTLCDPNQLESALLSLVINARDAMPAGGRLVIETANAVLADRRGAPRSMPAFNVSPGDYVVLTVTDTGAGMAWDVLARAFDPFFTTKPLGQGTGLGLSMIHGFVQQSGGQVRLRSGEGQGTTVAIYLPRYTGTANGERECANADPSQAKASAVVLVVEDEPAMCAIIVEVLSDLGYTVLEAGDGRSGLDVVQATTRIDLLLTDVGLPGGINGRQLADAARQRRPGLKVLFITGYSEGVAAGESLLGEGMQVLTKPFRVAALAARVQGIIDT